MSAGLYCFGRFRLIVRERLLMKDDAPVHLGGRAFDLLLALVERAGETVLRNELFDLIWPEVIVATVNLRVHVAALRKALGDGRDGNRFIVNVAGRGYRFVAEVRRLELDVPAAARSIERIYRQATTPPFTEVCFVDLTGVDSPAQLATAVASALGCESERKQRVVRVLAYLQNRETMAIFDNGERGSAGVEQLLKQ